MSHSFPDNSRANEFRVTYANASAVQFDGLQCIITFGVQHVLGDLAKGVEEQVAVAMTPVAAKSMAYSVMRILEHAEKIAGNVIPIDPTLDAKLAELTKNIDAS